MLGPLSRIANQSGREVTRSFIRRYGDAGGVPGENLPFNIHNRVRLTVNFFIYGLTGFGAPFLILYHQLRKK